MRRTSTAYLLLAWCLQSLESTVVLEQTGQHELAPVEHDQLSLSATCQQRFVETTQHAGGHEHRELKSWAHSSSPAGWISVSSGALLIQRSYLKKTTIYV
jgi:hypothetical protein